MSKLRTSDGRPSLACWVLGSSPMGGTLEPSSAARGNDRVAQRPDTPIAPGTHLAQSPSARRRVRWLNCSRSVVGSRLAFEFHVLYRRSPTSPPRFLLRALAAGGVVSAAACGGHVGAPPYEGDDAAAEASRDKEPAGSGSGVDGSGTSSSGGTSGSGTSASGGFSGSGTSASSGAGSGFERAPLLTYLPSASDAGRD
jgi:uncharacterized membrane protein YgcG